LRPIQIWVPDVRPSGFKAQAHRQLLTVPTSLRRLKDQSSIEDVPDLRLDEGVE
jgi:hypothetical protein